jgi:hypothetical protein
MKLGEHAVGECAKDCLKKTSSKSRHAVRQATKTFSADVATGTSGASSTDVCDPTDLACNYCLDAMLQIDYCEATLADAGYSEDYLPDCLCYGSYNDPQEGYYEAWSPMYFDVAFDYCPVYAARVAPADLKAIKSATHYCNGLGNYYSMTLTDTDTYELAIATAAPLTSGTTLARTTSNIAVVAVQSTASVRTDTNTVAISTGGSSRVSSAASSAGFLSSTRTSVAAAATGAAHQLQVVSFYHPVTYLHRWLTIGSQQSPLALVGVVVFGLVF